MTDNVIAQITSATADAQDSTGAERPAAPEGSVYLSDVLARIRQHAADNHWCSTAESITLQALNDGLSFKPLRRVNQGCSDPSCQTCDAVADLADERFTPADSTDPFITKARLKTAIRKAINLGYDYDEYCALYREFVEAYDLDAVPLPVRTYTVTFTVTEEQLRGRAADEAGMAYVLRNARAADFAVSVESTEEATATLMR
ncbi:hypothetical protein Q0Z83_110590 [Actinoplanes sichuanensis]|uniref:Uncharacterized protein n=1 Tax=Actinoplanes sichuanensis TaxID=512349 RepID=A0ABW4A2C6_9ACTN|nr:hypothetical protein [Actinoplanes sichuanensis]BEL12868.1 hypothetical protein Q0Z83_110590 [Actinoplanes sichuanensis]